MIFLVQASNLPLKEESSHPLGILSVASYLRDILGEPVRVYDTQLGSGEMDRFLHDVSRTRPFLVGISSMTPSAGAMHLLARKTKELSPASKVVVGGAHPSSYPEGVLQDGNIEYLVAGEGEPALESLLEAAKGRSGGRSCPGVWFRREDGTLHHGGFGVPVDNLDGLPAPAYDLLSFERYFDLPRIGIVYAHRRYATLITSRGCPYHCIFCHKIHGRKYRTNSPETVLTRIVGLKSRFNVGEIVVVDDIFNLDAGRLRDICRLLIKEKLGLKLSFPNGFRGDLMDEESVLLLKQAGMYRCMFAFETASPRLQKMIGKNLDVSRVVDIVHKTSRLGIMTNGTFMLGFPGETLAEMKATVALAAGSSLDTAVFLRPVPFPGTVLMQLAGGSDAYPRERFEDFNYLRSRMNLSGVPEKKAHRMKQFAYLRFYASPSRIWRIFRLLPNRRETIPLILKTFFQRAFLW